MSVNSLSSKHEVASKPNPSKSYTQSSPKRSRNRSMFMVDPSNSSFSSWIPSASSNVYYFSNLSTTHNVLSSLVTVDDDQYLELNDPSRKDNQSLEETLTGVTTIHRTKKFKGSNLGYNRRRYASIANQKSYFKTRPTLPTPNSPVSVSHLESQIPKMSLKSTLPGSDTSAKTTVSEKSAEISSGHPQLDSQEQGPTTIKRSLKRRFKPVQKAAIPVPERPATSRASSIIDSEPGLTITQDHNTLLNALKLPASFSTPRKRCTSSTLNPAYRKGLDVVTGHRASSVNSIHMHGSISQYSEEIMSHQQKMLHSRAAEIKGLKATIAGLELDKQVSENETSKLHNRVLDLEAQLDTLTLQLEKETARSDGHHKEVTGLQEKLNRDVLAKEQELQKRIKECHKRFEFQLRKTDEGFTATIHKLQQAQSKTVAECTTKLARQAEENKIHAANAKSLTQKNNELSQTVSDLENVVAHKEDKITESESLLKKMESQLAAYKNDVFRYKEIIYSNQLSSADQQNQLQDELQDARSQILVLNEELRNTNQHVVETHVSLIKEESLRRKLHNQVQDMKGNLRVYCRVRPLLASEEAALAAQDPSDRGALIDLEFPDSDADGQQLCLKTHKLSATNRPITDTHSFEFDKVFGPKDTTGTVFKDVSELIQSAVDGYSVCIFAYGQTGSGKTYTMTQPGKGIVAQAIEQLFQARDKMCALGWDYEMTGQVLEIYNEKMYDLLARDGNNNSGDLSQKLSIKHCHDTRTTTVQGLSEVPLASPQQTAGLLAHASKTRSTAATDRNEHSSRSHSIFVIRLCGVHVGNKELDIPATRERRQGVLNLVDLAGSERLSLSKAQEERVKETQAINKSLSSLVDVISAMANNCNGPAVSRGCFPNRPNTPIKEIGPGAAQSQFFIPFRNSKLTHFLQYSLSGNAKTLMLVNVSPFKEHEQETLRSLRFASMANRTKIR